MMMVTFTKLLVIRMVANVRSEFSRNFRILRSASFLSSSSSFRLLGDKEKKAISDPDVKAENTNSTHAKTQEMIAPVVGTTN